MVASRAIVQREHDWDGTIDSVGTARNKLHILIIRLKMRWKAALEK